MVDLFRGSSWSLPFLITIVVSSAVTLSFLGYTFAAFEANTIGDASVAPESRTIPTYLALFIFAEVRMSCIYL
jgi:hypothetical protein